MRPGRAAALALCVAAVCLAQVGDSAPRRVEFLTPIPRLAQSDAGIVLKVRILPLPESFRLIVMAIDVGGEVVRRTDEDLHGEQSVRTRFVRWTSIPAGDLLIVAEQWDRQKPLGRAQFPLCVRDTFDEICQSLVAHP